MTLVHLDKNIGVLAPDLRGYIYHTDRKAYWRAPLQGMTEDVSKAHNYTFKQAVELTAGCNRSILYFVPEGGTD